MIIWVSRLNGILFRGACESSEDQWSALEKRFEAEFNITEEERAEAYDVCNLSLSSFKLFINAKEPI